MQINDSLIPGIVRSICEKFARKKGRGFLVGGCVRDLLLGRKPWDFDIEVYGLSLDEVCSSLSDLGRCKLVGKSFGVVKLKIDDTEIDVALPRKEYKVAKGHRGFSVQFDPTLDPQTASSRRDFTINAMMYDPLQAKLYDFHGGMRDLEEGWLRHISPAFKEDPLRVLRAMQFASRYRLRLAPETSRICREMIKEANALAIERIWQEWRKWAEGRWPSFGLTALRESGWLSLYPPLEAMVGCPQEKRWHPEGDVWRHTLLVVDRAAEIGIQRGWDIDRRRILVFAALCHDIGKPETTVFDRQRRCIRSPEHSAVGEVLASRFLKSIGAPRLLLQWVLPLVREHLTHMHGPPTPRAVRRLAARLDPVDMAMWEALVEADASGRTPLPPCRPALTWLQQAKKLSSHRGKPKPLVTGKLLLRLGMSPGPKMGEMIRMAYKAQLDGAFQDEAGALEWCRNRLGSLNSH